MISLGDQRIDIEVPLPLIRFLRQYVTRMRVTTLNLAGSRSSKPLRRALMCF
jgi:hypothetical protein